MNINNYQCTNIMSLELWIPDERLQHSDGAQKWARHIEEDRKDSFVLIFFVFTFEEVATSSLIRVDWRETAFIWVRPDR